jgi:hypothetical protein
MRFHGGNRASAMALEQVSVRPLHRSELEHPPAFGTAQLAKAPLEPAVGKERQGAGPVAVERRRKRARPLAAEQIQRILRRRRRLDQGYRARAETRGEAPDRGHQTVPATPKPGRLDAACLPPAIEQALDTAKRRPHHAGWPPIILRLLPLDRLGR